MRVECRSIADFLTNLERQLGNGGTVYDSVIYLDVSRVSHQDYKTEVTVQTSAVVQLADSEYLIQAGEFCGVDYQDGEQEQEGSDNSQRLTNRLEAFCKANSLQLLPGVIGV